MSSETPWVQPHPRPDFKPEQKPYEPVGKAKEFLLCKASEVLLAGPAGTGKTRVGCEKLHLLCEKYPGSRHLLLRQTRKSLTETALVTLEEHVMPAGHPAKSGARREQRSKYTYSNGSEIVVAGLDNPDKIMSGEYDTIYIPEALETREADVEQITTRLRNGKMPYQQLLMDCNPGTPQHWLLGRWKRGLLEKIDSTHEDNPRLYDRRRGEWTEEGKRYLAVLDRLSGARKQRLRYGKWIAPEGARWPHAVREIQGFSITGTWPQGIPEGALKWISLDYGLAAPYCGLWHLRVENGDIYTFREDYEAGLTADRQAQRVISLSPPNESYYAVYADPATWSKNPRHEQQDTKSAHEYYEHEFRPHKRFGPLVKGQRNEADIGYQTLDVLLNRDNNEPNWFIELGCENLWRELEEAVHYQSPTTGIWEEHLDPRCDDHALTCAVYGLHKHLRRPLRSDGETKIDYEAIWAARQQKELEANERIARNRGTTKIRV